MAVLGDRTREVGNRRLGVTLLFGLAAAGLVPWIVVLGRELPSARRAPHWDVAWVGLDVALLVLLVGVAVGAWRRASWLQAVAAAAATLLAADAWFDVLTAATGAELVAALAEAALVELPLAVVCVFVARAAGARRRRDVRERSDAWR
ncbi:MAG TPA: hypothetical protein VE777_01435 [Gaiellales bacterium]|jgi:hypothetical protein|nr:hypothetical protein [Gaiellales bacterium]